LTDQRNPSTDRRNPLTEWWNHPADREEVCTDRNWKRAGADNRSLGRVGMNLTCGRVLARADTTYATQVTLSAEWVWAGRAVAD